MALVLRFASFGDPNIHIDEAFYFHVGLQMHEGAVPYVDIWDRKPIGLFLLYWAFAGVSKTVLSYQIAAWIAAGYTAWIISRIVGTFGPRSAGLLAAACYLALLAPLNGQGGQSPVFYNALIASAVWLIFAEQNRREVFRPGWRSVLAIGLAGIALTIKQTTAFEGAFLGLSILWLTARSGARVREVALAGAGLLLIGAIPFIAFGAWYWLAGHWDAFWLAMVQSNLNRSVVNEAVGGNALVILHALQLLPIGALAALLMARAYPEFARYRIWLSGWLAAALLGFLSAPYFLDHYALPLLVPLCVICAAHFGRSLAGNVLGVMIVGIALYQTNPFEIESHQRSRTTYDRMHAAISANADEGTLFIYEGPMLLYSHPDVQAMGPVIFPWHIVSPFEAGTSPFNQERELKRILAAKPEFVTVTDDWFREPYPGALDSLRSYLEEECTLLYSGERPNRRGRDVMSYLYGNCAGK